MALKSKDLNNWTYLVAAVRNPNSNYLNAKAGRYARAIEAVDAELERAGLKNLDSNSANVVVDRDSCDVQ